jgi:flavodoxin
MAREVLFMTTKLRTQDTGEGRARQETIRADLGAPTRLGRRSFLRAALAGVASVVIGAQMSGCVESSSRDVDNEDGYTPVRPTSPLSAAQPTALQTTPTSTSSSSDSGSKVLLVYFSRPGENYYYGGRTQLEVGNTEVLTGMISPLIGCDVHRIEPVDPYPDDYEETVARNVREQDADARPAIANSLASIVLYDIVLLGSPIWNVRAPMIMSTFVEGFDFSGKTVIPFVTYAVSGLGTTVRDYAASCRGATIGEGLAVRGEEVRDAGAAVEAWLRRIKLLKT